jgi:hypothetical protein
VSVIVVGSALAIAVLLFAFLFGAAAARRRPSLRRGADSASWTALSDGGGYLDSANSGSPCDSGSSDGGGCDGGGGGGD